MDEMRLARLFDLLSQVADVNVDYIARCGRFELVDVLPYIGTGYSLPGPHS